MRMFWYCSDINNFGDIVPGYVMEKLTGIKPEFNDKLDEQTMLYGGSILQNANKNSIIYGCGFGGKTEILKEAPLKIISVRGELSRQMLIDQGYECPECYGDMVNILPSIYNPIVTKSHRYGYFPHHSDYELVRKEYGDELTIDICSGVENVIDKMKQFKILYCSSLHSIIACKAYDIAWEWVKWKDEIPGDGMKFQDYFSTILHFQDNPKQL